MIIYFAGSGTKLENSEKLAEHKCTDWGILLSYKDIKTKNNEGSSRFQKLIKRKKL